MQVYKKEFQITFLGKANSVTFFFPEVRNEEAVPVPQPQPPVGPAPAPAFPVPQLPVLAPAPGRRRGRPVGSRNRRRNPENAPALPENNAENHRESKYFMLELSFRK